MCSPLATDDYVLLLTPAGTLTCYDAKSGKKLWEKEFEAHFKASPTLVGKHLPDQRRGEMLDRRARRRRSARRSARPSWARTARPARRCTMRPDVSSRERKTCICIGGKCRDATQLPPIDLIRRSNRRAAGPPPGGRDPHPPGDPDALPLSAARGARAGLRVDRYHARRRLRACRPSTPSSAIARWAASDQRLPRHGLPRQRRPS